MFVDILALVLGILLTIRKLDIKKREHADHPNVDRDAFERWKRTEHSAYSLGSFACFLKILVDFGFRFLATKTELPWDLVRVVGASIFFAWVVALIVAAVRAGSGRRLREELGIDLRAAPTEPGGRSDRT